MICSVELPVKYLLKYSNCFDYDFVIASTWIEYPEYVEYFINEKRKKRFTILDNGAFEKGKSIDDGRYIEIVEELCPDVIVLPDVYKNSLLTLERSRNFLGRWKEHELRRGRESIELMGVVQGRSWSDVERLADEYCSSGVSRIGVPYATGLDRYQLIKKHPEWKKVHILGLPVITEVLALCTLPNVVSIDSSLPVKYTKRGKYLLDAYHSMEIRVKPSEDSLCRYATAATLFRLNLEAFSKVCHSGITLEYSRRKKEEG